MKIGLFGFSFFLLCGLELLEEWYFGAIAGADTRNSLLLLPWLLFPY
jgi:hypothetical protein